MHVCVCEMSVDSAGSVWNAWLLVSMCLCVCTCVCAFVQVCVCVWPWPMTHTQQNFWSHTPTLNWNGTCSSHGKVCFVLVTQLFLLLVPKRFRFNEHWIRLIEFGLKLKIGAICQQVKILLIISKGQLLSRGTAERYFYHVQAWQIGNKGTQFCEV